MPQSAGLSPLPRAIPWTLRLPRSSRARQPHPVDLRPQRAAQHPLHPGQVPVHRLGVPARSVQPVVEHDQAAGLQAVRVLDRRLQPDQRRAGHLRQVHGQVVRDEPLPPLAPGVEPDQAPEGQGTREANARDAAASRRGPRTAFQEPERKPTAAAVTWAMKSTTVGQGFGWRTRHRMKAQVTTKAVAPTNSDASVLRLAQRRVGFAHSVSPPGSLPRGMPHRGRRRRSASPTTGRRRPPGRRSGRPGPPGASWRSRSRGRATSSRRVRQVAPCPATGSRRTSGRTNLHPPPGGEQGHRGGVCDDRRPQVTSHGLPLGLRPDPPGRPGSPR